MKWLFALLAATTLTVTHASAQYGYAYLGGQYQCLQNCAGPALAFVTQNGWEMNIVNEAGQPARAWIDRPGHIWVQYWDVGGVYSPDGQTIQFDNGTVWQRVVPVLVPAPPPVLNSRG
jgi:hypothetical protein